MKNPVSSPGDAAIDTLLAAALAGKVASWPWGVNDEQINTAVLERIRYHGIGVLLNELEGWPESWPNTMGAAIKRELLPQALWELRHSIVVAELVERLAGQGILAIILKGTGIAYEYYANPVLRARGDTDLLVDKTNLQACRAELVALGYICDTSFADVSDELKLQEAWSLHCSDATVHHIDLHWQVMNAPALAGVLTYADCEANISNLPRLSEHAVTLNRVLMLVHTLLHRATHIQTPYLVDNKSFYGGNRLIWAYDIALLAKVMTAEEWQKFCSYCLERRVAVVCLDGLQFATRAFCGLVPDFVMAELAGASPDEPGSRYLLRSGQFSRSMQDLAAVGGWRNTASYALARLLPSRSFMRGKYPEMLERPLIALYLRRLKELFHIRSERGAR